MSIDKLEEKIKKNKKQRTQSPQTDSLGRVYNKSPGYLPFEINYEDCEEIKDIALEVIDTLLEREILRSFILDGILIFKKSTGRRGKANSYIMGIKTDVRCLLEIDWVYCIEATSRFFELNLRDKYRSILTQLARIPERTIPSGSLVPYNSFSGLDYLVEDVDTLIKEKQDLT